MYEEQIVKSLINIIETKAIKENLDSPRLAVINIGMFNTNNRQMIIATFDELKLKSKILKTTQLKLNAKHGKIKCNNCSEETEIKKICNISEVSCPKCESFDIEILEGEEIEVSRIERVK